MPKNNTILITGASGFAGYSIFKSFSNLDSIGVYHKHVPDFGVVRCCDMTKKQEVKKLIEEINPNTVVHLAALPGPAVNEKHKDIARKLNVDITENLTYNLDKNVHFIFSSTDAVFDGTHPYPDENTPTSPKSFHGQLKVECENIIQDNFKKFHILRLSTIHSNNNYNIISKSKTVTSFVNIAMEILRCQKEVEVFTNIKRCFTKLNELVQLYNILINNDNYGIYNAGSKMTSYYDRIVAMCLENNINYDNNLRGVIGNVFPTTQNLSTEKLSKTFDFHFS